MTNGQNGRLWMNNANDIASWSPTGVVEALVADCNCEQCAICSEKGSGKCLDP